MGQQVVISKPKRNIFLDVLKGIVIFLMLWGHCIQTMIPSGIDFFENWVFKIIYSFHMPCFALISGYLLGHSFADKEINSVLGKRIINLAIPIVFASICNAILCYFPYMILNFNMQSVMKLIRGMASASSLWFFWSILASVIAIGVAKHISQKIWAQILCLLVFVPFVYILPCGTYNVFIYPYVVIGYYFYEIKKHAFVKKLTALGYLTIPLFFCLLCFYEKKHYIYVIGLFSSEYSTVQNIGINLYRYAIGLVGSIAFILIVKIIFKLFKEKVLFKLDYLGKKSLQIYALSVALLSFYLPKIANFIYEKCNVIEIYFANNQGIYSLVVTFVVAVLYCFVLSGVLLLFDKAKITKYIYGR